MSELPDLKELTDEAKDALILFTVGSIAETTEKEAQENLQKFELAARERI